MKGVKNEIALFVIFFILIWGKVCYAFDPFEKLKSLTETAVEAFKGKKLPKVIAVLPATGEGEEQDKIEIRTSFSNHISYKNYEQLKLNDIDAKLLLLTKEKGVSWERLSPQEIGKALNVDGLVYVHIVGIEKVYAALYASLTLKLRVKLVSAETGEVLWEKEDAVTERSGGVPTTPWGAISTAVSSALVLRESVKVALTDKLCRSLAKEMPEPKERLTKRPPAIYSVITNALDSPFKAQDEILVSLTGEEGMMAYFNIGEEKKVIQLSEVKPGEYLGKYVVIEGDNWKNKTITAYLLNPKDKTEARYIVPHQITVDTIPPEPVSDVKFTMQKEGFYITWSPSKSEDVKDYVIQRATVESPDYIEVAAVSVPEYVDKDISFGKKYYYRIFARDKAKNLSKYVEVSRVAVKQGPTYVTGEIKENTTFYSVGSPYVLTGEITVVNGATLTVEEGTVIEFERDAKLVVAGKLAILGKKNALVTIKGSEYTIIIRDTTKDGMLADYAYFMGGKRFVISNAFAKFNNVTFEDFNSALILERNSDVTLKDSIIRKTKFALKSIDSNLLLQGLEISNADKALEVLGSSKVTSVGLKLKNNGIHILTENELELMELEVFENNEIDLLKKIKGKVKVAKVLPYNKQFSALKKETIDSIKKDLAIALQREKLDEALKKIELIEELSQSDFKELSDIASYIFHRAGNTEKALTLLKEGQLKSQKELEKFLKLGDQSGLTFKFVDIKVPLGLSSEGVDRNAQTKAKWRAVKAFAEEKVGDIDRDRLSILNDKIIPKSSEYVVNVVSIYTGMTDVSFEGYYMVIIDTPKLIADLKEQRLVGEAKRETKFGIVDCTGIGISKVNITKALSRLNFEFVEYGMGSCEPINYIEKAKGHQIDVLLMISERAKASPSLLGGNLKNIQTDLEIKAFDVFLNRPLFTITKGANIYHLNEETGKEIALKNTYNELSERFEMEVLAIEKQFTTDDAHRRAKRAYYAEKHLTPIELKVVNVKPVFANNYKEYGENPFIELEVTNNTASTLESLKVVFIVKDFMDFPSEVKIDRLESLATKKIALTAIFNNKILELTENTALQSNIAVKFVKEGMEKEVSITHPLNVYEKHALVWDDRRKLAIFITPKDPTVVDFSRSISRSVSDKVYSHNVSLGMAVFEALRAIGLVYQQDPNNPYQVVSEKIETVDYVQYARETLKRKAGDCDDLVSLYASVMESLGIKTAAIDFPGHILVMFDAGIAKEDLDHVGLSKEMVVIYNDNVYVPVELTLLNEDFYNAWQRGVKNYKENLGKGLKIVSIEEAWRLYKPATLPYENITVKLPDNFGYFYRNSYEELLKSRNETILKNLETKMTTYVQCLYAIYSYSGISDAISLGNFLVNSGVDDPKLYNDLANLYFLDKKYQTALNYYKKALSKDRENPFVLVNLLKTYKKMGQKSEYLATIEKVRKKAPFLLEE